MNTTPRGPTSGVERPHPLVIGATLTSVLVMVVVAIVAARDVPDQLVTRWGFDGAPTSRSSLWGLTLGMSLVAIVEGILLGSIGARTGHAGAQRIVTGLAAGIPPALAVLHLGMVVAAVQQGADARFPPEAGVGAVGVLAGMAVLGHRLADPTPRPDRLIASPEIEVAPGEAVVWSGRTTAPTWLWAVLLGAVAVVVALAWREAPLLAVAVVAVVLLSSTVLVARLTVGPGGVSVRLGPFGLVRFRVRIEDITAVDAIEVDPLAHGGWGLRLLPGLRGVIFAAGPGLRVEQRDGPTTVVTTPDAAEAAGVLRAHLETDAQRA